MSRKRKEVPAYRLHAASGQAIMSLYLPNGQRKTIYLGKYRSVDSKIEYRRQLAQLDASPAAAAIQATMPAAPSNAPKCITIAELIDVFWEHAKTYYRNADGSPGRELDDFSLSFRPLRRLYDDLPANEFGPLALVTCRKQMLDDNLGRKTINQRIARIRAIFKFATAQQLLPVAIYDALKAVEPLHKGRTSAPEGEAVKPVSDAHYNATLPYCSKPIAAILKLLRLSGARPGELCIMRPKDIDTSETVWAYSPSTHKTAKRGRDRVVYFNPQAQLVLKPYLADCPDNEFVFAPIRERQKRFDELRRNRKTKVQPSQIDRSQPKAQRLPGPRYNPRAISHAVAVACKKAGVPHWHPYQIRHAFGTQVRKIHGSEASQILLGHAKLNTTEIYAQRDERKAREVVAMVG